jgi:hypothetical protein
MNKTARLMSSLISVLTLTALSILPVYGKMQYGPKPSAATEDFRVPLGSTRTLLPDGRVLVVGGENSEGQVQATVSTLDQLTEAVTVLDVRLHFPRSAHTATVLPDGTVLILGGIGQNGKVVSSSEVFDPISVTTRLLTPQRPAARAFQTATLLTDGRVLIAGGIFADSTTASALELWDPKGLNSAILPAQVAMTRRNHTASLLADGTVLFSGGQDVNGNSLGNFLIFDPNSQTVSVVATLQSVQESTGALTEMQASSPQDGAQNVSISALIAVRFSRPVQMASVGATTVILQGPNGTTNGRVIAAEGGMLAFITPASLLLAATSYTSIPQTKALLIRSFLFPLSAECLEITAAMNGVRPRTGRPTGQSRRLSYCRISKDLAEPLL